MRARAITTLTRVTARAALIAVVLGAVAREARAAGALESIASQAAKGIGAPAGAIVVSAPLVSDGPAPRGEELAARLAALVAGALGGAAHAHGQTATLAQARAIAAHAGSLVFVQPEIAKGALRATVDVFPVLSNGWDRVRVPAPPPRGHAFVQAAIDAEVRAFLPSIALERASIHKATHGEGDVLAVACGDLDGDGGMELALVSRARVAVGRVVKGAFVPSRTAPWSALAPRATVPMREPLAGAAIHVDVEHASLLVGTTDRGGVALDGALAPVGALRGIPFAAAGDACATPSAEAGAFEGDAVSCGPDAKSVARVASLPARYDAIAAADVVSADGRVRSSVVARDPAGKLALRLGDAIATLDGAGAQVALADLDQDGTPEIAASGAPLTDADDAITVWTWDGASEPRARVKLPAPGGVRALCTCPPESGGAPALVAVVGGEVWIVR